MTLFSAHDVHLEIGGKRVTKDLSFSIANGQVWGMLGANGVGKTTLLHAMAGLRPVDGGHFELVGKHLDTLKRRSIARRLGLVPQHSFDQFAATVRETVLMGRHPHTRLLRGETANDISTAETVMQAFDISDLADRRVDTLSGGERRRVAVATTMCQEPKVCLLDEPTNHLDIKHQFDLFEKVVELTRASDACLVAILHDVNLVSRFCSHAMLLFGDGEVVTGPADLLLSRDNLGRLYGRPVIDTLIGGRKVFVPA